MLNLKPVNVIPPVKLLKGPDEIRGNGLAFIYTAYPDENGKRFFIVPGDVGHEQMILDPNIQKAMLGPKYEELKDSFTVFQDGKKHYDHWEIRRLTANSNLYGRYGKLSGHHVVMLWQMPANWLDMLENVLKELDVPSDVIITAGRNNQFVLSKKKETTPKATESPEEKEKMQALLRYHQATGDEKEALRKVLELTPPSTDYPDVSTWSDEQKDRFRWKRKDWRSKAKNLNLQGVFDYGESFRNWLKGQKDA